MAEEPAGSAAPAAGGGGAPVMMGRSWRKVSIRAPA